MLHLGDGIVFQDDNQLAVLFRLLQPLRLAAIVIFQSYDSIGITLVVRDNDGSTKAANAPGRYLHTTCGDTAHGDTPTLFIARAFLGSDGVPSQHTVHRFSDIAMHDEFLPALLFNHHIEGRWRFTFQDTLLRMTAPRLLVTEGHGLDSADKIRERRVDQQITQ